MSYVIGAVAWRLSGMPCVEAPIASRPGSTRPFSVGNFGSERPDPRA
jgi:hypothetical protein